MSKKKVTAPLTYDPGKGRPKEHLAYLNWQEMQELKRINGGNQERGPMGLPSFPPGTRSTSSTSKSSTSSTSKSSTGARGPTGPKGEPRSSPAAGGKAGSVSRSAGTTRSSSERSGGSGVTGSKGGGASTQRAGAGKGMSKAGEVSKSRNAAQAGNLAADRARASRESGVKSLSVGPMGTRVDVTKKTPGQQIKGAIKGVQETAKAPPRTAAEIERAGVFGAPSYSGLYNPATGRLDRPPVAAVPQTVNRLGMADYGPVLPSGTSGVWGGRPQTVNRIEKTSFQGVRPSGTMTQFGGPAVDVVNRLGKVDMPAPARSISDTLSDYATSIGDTVYSGIRSIGSMLPGQPVEVSPADVRRAIESMRYQEPSIAPSSAYTGYGGYMPSPQATYDALTGSSVLSTALDKAPSPILDSGGIRKTVSPPQTKFDEDTMRMARMNELEQEARRIAEMDVESFTDPSTVPSLGYGNFNVPAARPGLPSKIAGYDVYNPAEYENALQTRVPSWRQGLTATPTREITVEPMGGVVPEEPRMVGQARIPTEETYLPFQDRVYDTPYPVDENGVPIQNVSPADLAKIRARRRGEEYVQTPEEKQAEIAGGIASGVVTNRIPGARQFFNVRENIRDYQSRPSWEQSYIQDRARASGITDIGSSRSSNERPDLGGIASLSTTAPAPTSSTTGTSANTSTSNPYYWDLGLNIPSPTDKNYTDYQKYLAQRAAAQAAMYG